MKQEKRIGSICGFLTLILAVFISAPSTVKAEDLNGESEMKIIVQTGATRIVYQLNDSAAAQALVAQLPLEVTVEDYAGLEKIFYPPQKLNTSNTPLARHNKLGTLAYYAPWADVVMFYGNSGSASGLYELGQVVSGQEHLSTLSGTIRIEKE